MLEVSILLALVSAVAFCTVLVLCENPEVKCKEVMFEPPC